MRPMSPAAQTLKDPQQLYEDWERSHWAAQDIDLSRDPADWAGLDEGERELLYFVLSSLMVAEERISTQFCGLVLAQDDEEEGSYLSTQLVDEVRHMQFYARFQNEVIADPAAIGAHVARAREVLGEPFKYIFDEALVKAHDRLRLDPGDREAKVDFVTIYHMVLEGTLGHRHLPLPARPARGARAAARLRGRLRPDRQRRAAPHRLRHLVPARGGRRRPGDGRRDPRAAPGPAAPRRPGARAAGRGSARRARRRGRGAGGVRARRAQPPARHHRREPVMEAAAVPRPGWTFAQKAIVVVAALQLAWAVAGLIAEPSFELGDDAPTEKVLGIDFNGYHALAGFLLFAPAFFFALRPNWAVFYAIYAAAALIVTGVWALFETPGGDLLHLPQQRGRRDLPPRDRRRLRRDRGCPALARSP